MNEAEKAAREKKVIPFRPRAEKEPVLTPDWDFIKSFSDAEGRQRYPRRETAWIEPAAEKPIKVYRATSEPFDPKKMGEAGFYVSPSEQIAGYFKGKGQFIEELGLKKDAKILEFKDIPEELKNIKDWDEYSPNVAKYAKQHGYDAVQSTEKTELTIVNPDVVKKEVPDAITTREKPKSFEREHPSGRDRLLEGGEVPKEEEKIETPSSKVASFVSGMLEKGNRFEKAELFGSANRAYGGKMSEGKYNAKDAFDAMELGINKYLETSKITPSDNPQIDIDKIRKEITNKIPSQQGLRTAEQEEFQQYSTPPDLAYTMAWAANITPADTILEPSAGVGGLAVFAKSAGAKTIVNELSPRRADLLKQMGFDQVFTENAEQLNNILPKDVKPTVVLMNPPFSATAGRMKGERASVNVIAHLDQALKRLQDGGRLVALIGKGWFDDPKAVQDYLKNLVDNYNLRANITVGGKGYAKYGTTYDNRILVVDKSPPEGKPTVTGTVEDVKDAIPLLQGVRDARSIIEPRQVEPEVQRVSPQPEEGPRREPTILPPTYGVGAGEREIAGEGLQAEEYPRPPVRGEAEPGIPLPEAGGGRGGIPSDPGPGRLEEPGRPGGRIAERPRLEGEPSPEGGISPAEAGTVELERAKEETRPTDITDSLYENYKPKKAIVKGSQPHPGPIVESAAMASVDPPEATYKPHLPSEIIDKGKLSNVQLESIIYTGQAHQEIMPNGERMGFFIGDGTGVGKGREIAGILLDNWNQGRKKAIWLSQNSPLIEDAKRDVKGVGWNPDLIFDVGKVKLGSPIKNTQGIAFVGYDLLRTKKKEKPIAKEEEKIQPVAEPTGKIPAESNH